MKSRQSTIVSTEVLRQSGAPGTLEVFDLSHERARDKKLVVLVEIEISDRDNEIIVEDIVRELEYQFFNAPTQETEYAFENALAKANIKIKDTLLGKPKNWLNRIHIAVLGLAESEVHLAAVGMVHAFLVHNEKIVDVLKSPNDASAPNPIKLFTNIISGKLTNETALVLTNESVLDYLSVERIRKCAREFEAPEACAALTELLARAPSHKQFALAVVSPARASVEPRETARPSVPKARYAEEATLAAEYQPALPESAPYPEAITRFEEGGQTAQAVLARMGQYSRAALTFMLATLAKLLEAFQRALKRAIPAMVAFEKTVAASLKNGNTRSYMRQRIKNTAAAWTRNLVYGQSKKRKLAGLAAVALVLVFAGSIAVRARRQNQESRIAEFQGRIARVEQKVSEAEASLIYGNKIKSQTLLAEVQALIAELEREFPDEEARYQALAGAIATLQNKSEKKQPISDIATVATIIPAPISANESGLAALGETIFFYDGVQEKIARLDAENGLLLSLALTPSGMAPFNTALPLEGSAIAALAPQAALIVDADGETVARQEFPYAPESAKPFAAYGTSLYTWSAEENQIIRFRRAGAGFTAPQKWLTGEYEFATMQDIAVDGFVYLLDSQGTIHAFLRGSLNKTIPWGAIELPGDYVRLYTTEQGTRLYVLDPAYSRVVITSKEGELLTQLTNPILNDVTDLAIGADEKSLYALAGDKIYRINIPDY
ncbi:MAG: hypothetical protein HYT31_03230 [Parcubacteria group bacterium]|nr:hypothetical protein [Parcubacteria group bacterium]